MWRIIPLSVKAKGEYFHLIVYSNMVCWFATDKQNHRS